MRTIVIAAAIAFVAGFSALMLLRGAGPEGPAPMTIVDDRLSVPAGGSAECPFALASGAESTWIEISIEPEHGARLDARLFVLGKKDPPLDAFAMDHIEGLARTSGSVTPDVYRLVLENADPARPARARVRIVRDFSR